MPDDVKRAPVINSVAGAAARAFFDQHRHRFPRPQTYPKTPRLDYRAGHTLVTVESLQRVYKLTPEQFATVFAGVPTYHRAGVAAIRVADTHRLNALKRGIA